ncbi:porin family protein [Maribacter sp. Asnod1-A12]|uniref:porin family protein n=1 Tax=Maribacter sp. Asnod1-A12 TaxID=3160576 RepID=UPI00386D07E2
MKKLIIVGFLALTSLYSGSLKAQSIYIGPKVGLNLANFTGNVNSSLRGLAALHVGGVAEIEIVDMFSIQPELLYSVKGAILDDTKLVNSYLSLPVMGKFYPIDMLYIEAGPQIGFLISANEKSNANNIKTTDSYKTVDLGLGFGAGVNLRDIGLSLGLRYNAGLSNIFIDNSRIKNGVFQISAAYTFEL